MPGDFKVNARIPGRTAWGRGFRSGTLARTQESRKHAKRQR